MLKISTHTHNRDHNSAPKPLTSAKPCILAGVMKVKSGFAGGDSTPRQVDGGKYREQETALQPMPDSAAFLLKIL
jgi:hypothetical protein